MPFEGVVDALRRLHRALRPVGVILDLEPSDEPSLLEVWRAGRVIPLGQRDEGEEIAALRSTRRELRRALRQRWFRLERERTFEGLTHYDTVADWLGDLEAEGLDAPGELVRRARRLLRGGGKIVWRQRLRATILRPLPQ